jgi:hypothetical protein
MNRHSGGYDSDSSDGYSSSAPSLIMTDHFEDFTAASSFARGTQPAITHVTESESDGPPSPVYSIYSLIPSVREGMLKNVHGRALNNSSDVYHLPADEEEIYRLGREESLIEAEMIG